MIEKDSYLNDQYVCLVYIAIKNDHLYPKKIKKRLFRLFFLGIILYFFVCYANFFPMV